MRVSGQVQVDQEPDEKILILVSPEALKANFPPRNLRKVRFKKTLCLPVKTVLSIRNNLSGISYEFLSPGSGSRFGSNTYYLRIFGNYFFKIPSNSIKKKNLPTICHFLFHNSVLRYTQSKIHRPKIIIFLFYFSALSFFCRQKFRIHNTGRFRLSTVKLS